MSEHVMTAEEVEFQAFMDAMVNSLRTGKSYEKYLGQKGFKRFLLGGLQAYALDVEKEKGLRINITADGLAVAIQDRHVLLNAKGTAQKKVFKVWSPGIGFELKATAKNSIDKKDRITVNPVTVTPGKLFIWNIQALVDEQIKGWGLYRLLKKNLNETLGKKGLEATSLWTRVTKSNLIYVYTEGGPIKSK